MLQTGDLVNISRHMKLLTSRQIRQVRDVCFFRINGMEVFCNFVKYKIDFYG